MGLLIVDDDLLFLRAWKRRMEATGIRVSIATHLAEGIAIAASEKPEVVILDVDFGTGPETGLRAIETFRLVSPDSEIVVATALWRDHDSVLAVDGYGCYAYVEKGDGLEGAITRAQTACLAHRPSIAERCHGFATEIRASRASPVKRTLH